MSTAADVMKTRARARNGDKDQEYGRTVRDLVTAIPVPPERTMPPMKRSVVIFVVSMVAACTSADSGETTGQTTSLPAAATTTPPASTPAERPSTDQILEDLGGFLCPESEFTCLTLEMPLDHFGPADGPLIPVTFAVLPASGERLGVFTSSAIVARTWPVRDHQRRGNC